MLLYIQTRCCLQRFQPVLSTFDWLIDWLLHKSLGKHFHNFNGLSLLMAWFMAAQSKYYHESSTFMNLEGSLIIDHKVFLKYLNINFLLYKIGIIWSVTTTTAVARVSRIHSPNSITWSRIHCPSSRKRGCSGSSWQSMNGSSAKIMIVRLKLGSTKNIST